MVTKSICEHVTPITKPDIAMSSCMVHAGTVVHEHDNINKDDYVTDSRMTENSNSNYIAELGWNGRKVTMVTVESVVEKLKL